LTFTNVLTHCPVDRVYPDGHAATDDIAASLSTAKFVYVFTGRGDELTENPPSAKFAPLFDANNRYDFVCIMLPDPDVPSDQYDWLADRAAGLSKREPNAERDLRAAVKANIFRLRGRIKAKTELRRFNVPNTGRIVVTDAFAFWGPYEPDKQGGPTPLYRVRSSSAVYAHLKGFCEHVRQASIMEAPSKSNPT